MSKKDVTISKENVALQKFLGINKEVDFTTLSLNDPELIKGLNWKGLSRQKEKVQNQLAGYQRLLRIMPGDNQEIIFSLLDAEVHSALQIAAIPKTAFMDSYLDLFNKDEDLADGLYQNALAMRTQLLLRHMQQVQ